MLNVKILSPLILSKVPKNMQTSVQESIVPESTMLRGHTMDLKTLKTNNDKNISTREISTCQDQSISWVDGISIDLYIMRETTNLPLWYTMLNRCK